MLSPIFQTVTYPMTRWEWDPDRWALHDCHGKHNCKVAHTHYPSFPIFTSNVTQLAMRNLEFGTALYETRNAKSCLGHGGGGSSTTKAEYVPARFNQFLACAQYRSTKVGIYKKERFLIDGKVPQYLLPANYLKRRAVALRYLKKHSETVKVVESMAERVKGGWRQDGVFVGTEMKHNRNQYRLLAERRDIRTTEVQCAAVLSAHAAACTTCHCEGGLLEGSFKNELIYIRDHAIDTENCNSWFGSVVTAFQGIVSFTRSNSLGAFLREHACSTQGGR
eukprot:TRINITY_DN9009_c0_g1_i1.p1 TRINITY_DN9009_c0_g1~~TRINITY_DN9009_c0_g1_i1.p1  ORF type:complete len:278 (+),score=17.31 TRINITY_DN9009_c0_g1_i1:251-1084(+)